MRPPLPPISGEELIQVAVGSATETGGRQWQVIAANILAHVLVELMPDLAAALAPPGHLILSGIIAEQAGSVVAAAEKQGLNLMERRVEGDWVALVVGRGASSQ